jgi:hypothetical protein
MGLLLRFRPTIVSSLEQHVESRILVSDLLSNLSPEEFEVLWFLTGLLPMHQIAHFTDMSLSQVHTVRFSLARKAQTYLSPDIPA